MAAATVTDAADAAARTAADFGFGSSKHLGSISSGIDISVD